MNSSDRHSLSQALTMNGDIKKVLFEKVYSKSALMAELEGKPVDHHLHCKTEGENTEEKAEKKNGESENSADMYLSESHQDQEHMDKASMLITGRFKAWSIVILQSTKNLK